MQIREDLNFGLKQCFTICVFLLTKGNGGVRLLPSQMQSYTIFVIDGWNHPMHNRSSSYMIRNLENAS